MRTQRLKNDLIGHQCQTVPEAGLAGKRNGELLALAEEAGFDVFVTVDRGIEYEQNLSRQNVAVVVMSAKSSRLADLLPLVPEVLKLLHSIKNRDLVRVGG